ncbi:hypothetical protein MLD38_011799 [Melastoma candidum]|uniref:Uncharacterized protein n=1 Tax=Melastoma candidum TaxID=119954 RepID=A0ACB9R607_9MYRT|nr:hypothetical protein MLD38_011799 [Melastoma candidum]
MVSSTSHLLLPFLASLLPPSASNIDQDRAECADQLVGLATCLPYVGGDSKNPTIDCCTGLKTVIDKSRKCLCVLIKDRDDPSLGIKINLTLALGLPTACHTPVNITECVDLLHLPHNSTEAKVFESTTSISNTTAAAATTPANSTSTATPTAVPATSASSKSHGGIKLRTSWGLVAAVISLLSSTNMVL